MNASPPRRRRRRVRARLALLATSLLLVPALLCVPLRHANAHKGGIAAPGCEGCHSGGKAATVTLTASPMAPTVGQAVNLTISVSQTNGPVAGFYLTTTYGGGTFKATETGTAIASGLTGGVLHTTPRTGSGGQTVFHASWSSATPAGVVFQVYALSANGDGSNRGDGPGEASLALAAGCTGKTYYLDQDGDGFGTNDPAYPPVLDCTRPQAYADNDKDCDDFHETVFPGNAEICDGRDNDCNGKIDDGCADGGAPLGTGGAVGTGGNRATGGATTATGGQTSTGGQRPTTGGQLATGGRPGTGGVTGGAGQATGGRATGGTPAGQPGTGGTTGTLDDAGGGCAVSGGAPRSIGALAFILGALGALVRRRRHAARIPGKMSDLP